MYFWGLLTETLHTMARLLKIIGIIILILILIPLIAGLFLPKEYSLTRSVEINQPKDTVFDYLVMLRNQEHYGVWFKIDPDMQQEFRGTDGTMGFVTAWDSDNKEAGKGEQEIIAIIPGERVDHEIRFQKPFRTVAQAWFTTEVAGEGSTLVTWGMSGKMNYPFNAMGLFMDMEKAIGKDYDQGLSELKRILEESK
jgi:hypothetical protein